MLDALLRAEPAQLRIAHEHIPCETHVVEQFLDVASDEGFGHGVDGSDDDIIAAADGEDESVAGITGIRGDDNIGRGIIRIGVHGVGAGEGGRCRESEIIGGDFGNNAHDALPSLEKCLISKREGGHSAALPSGGGQPDVSRRQW